MKISVILPVILAVGILCFAGGYVLREGTKVIYQPPAQVHKDGFRYQGPLVNVDTQGGVVHVGRRNLYEIGWDHGYTGKHNQADDYGRGYDAGRAARDIRYN